MIGPAQYLLHVSFLKSLIGHGNTNQGSVYLLASHCQVKLGYETTILAHVISWVVTKRELVVASAEQNDIGLKLCPGSRGRRSFVDG